MKIWVDADACPAAIKDILYRAAHRAQVPLTLIANQMLRVPPSPWIRALQVPSGFDVADQRIVEEAVSGDLVITADIPLAAQAIVKGACVLDPRGDLLDKSNIEERLTMRYGWPGSVLGRRSAGVCKPARQPSGKTPPHRLTPDFQSMQCAVLQSISALRAARAK